MNAVDKYNSSPVNEAAKHRQALAGNALMQANANPNIVDEFGWFILNYLIYHVKIQSGFKSKRRLKTDMEKFFIASLENGAHPNIFDCNLNCRAYTGGGFIKLSPHTKECVSK
ncbi:MAG: hypothetical protein H8E20_16000 [Verrucomicrobia bacterium]|nr:hypothetical protein [Verrucomicrobiota bacterium]